MNKPHSSIVLSIATCLFLGGNVALAADNKKFSEGAVSTIAKKSAFKEPWYVRNDDPDYVAYGIETDTWNGTDDAPSVQLIGTKGKSEILSLNNTAENFESDKDYFIFSGRDIGDVGIPTGIQFTNGGDDGWGMKNVKVDYLIIPEPETKWRKADTVPNWFSQFTNTNDRNKIRKTLKGYFDNELMVTKNPIKMDGRRGVDGNEERSDGIKFKKDVFLPAIGSNLNRFGNGGSQTVDLSAEVIVIDTRKSAVDITWQSTQKQTVTAGEVRGKMNSSSHETGWNNTTTVGVKVSGKKTAGVIETSAEFSLENSFSVHETNIKTAQDTNSKNLTNSFSSGSGQSYFVAAGSVAFIELKRTATVTRYTDFAEMQRIGPSISVQYFLTPRYYQTECSTGRLRLINAYHKEAGKKASFSFGAYLDHPSQGKYFKAAKAGFGGGFNASAPRGENCDS